MAKQVFTLPVLQLKWKALSSARTTRTSHGMGGPWLLQNRLYRPANPKSSSKCLLLENTRMGKSNNHKLMARLAKLLTGACSLNMPLHYHHCELMGLTTWPNPIYSCPIWTSLSHHAVTPTLIEQKELGNWWWSQRSLPPGCQILVLKSNMHPCGQQRWYPVAWGPPRSSSQVMQPCLSCWSSVYLYMIWIWVVQVDL